MRSHRFTAWAVLLAVCAIQAGAADQRMSRDDLLGEVQKLVSANMTGAQVFDVNGFHVESSHNKELGVDLKPDGAEFQAVFVSAPDTFRVVIEKGRPSSAGGGLAIFHRGSGDPMLSVGDSNGDGMLDTLTYSKVDAAGKILNSVTDYEADGQPDFRINFADHYSEIWHVDRWHRVENRGGRRGIVLDGNFVELRKEKNRYVVP